MPLKLNFRTGLMTGGLRLHRVSDIHPKAHKRSSVVLRRCGGEVNQRSSSAMGWYTGPYH